MVSLPRDWQPALRERLESLGRALERHPRLAGAFLYGDVVRDASEAPPTTVGLAVVMEALGDPADYELSEALHTAYVSARVEPWLILESELPRIADVFPVRLFEINRYGLHLCGRLESLGVASTREHLRLRTEQLARELLMQRRSNALIQRDPEPELGLAETASRLWMLLAVLDHLRGGTEQEGILERSTEALVLEGDHLERALEGDATALDEALVALVRSVDALAERR